MDDLIKIYPLPGAIVVGVPHRPQEVSPKRAAELISTGAFTDRPPAAAPVEQASADDGASDKE